MRGLNRQTQKWARFALKCGLLLTDAKLWESVRERLRDRVDDIGEEVKRRYDETERLHRAHNTLDGHTNWVTPAASFIGGIGVGVGLGLLLAPASGEETRSALRDKVVNLKNRVAAESTGYRTMHSSSTGTGGD